MASNDKKKDGDEKEKETAMLDERDIQLLSRYVSVTFRCLTLPFVDVCADSCFAMTAPFVFLTISCSIAFRWQGVGPYTNAIKKLETDIVEEMKKVNELIGA
jgi:hypothetical protein